MMATVVFDEEVPVERRGQGDAREPPLVFFPLVAELVSRVDRDASDAAQRHGQADRSDTERSILTSAQEDQTKAAYCIGRNAKVTHR